MKNLIVSSRVRLLALSTALTCVGAAGACVPQEDPASAGEPELETIHSVSPAQAKLLAQGLSRVVGATIRPQDLHVMAATRIFGLIPFSSLLEDTTGKWVVAEVATPVTANSFRAVIDGPSTWSAASGVSGLNAAVVVSSASIRTCPTAVCFMNSCVQGLATVPEDQGCPPLQCTSSAQCQNGGAPTCMVNSCDDGQCVVQEQDSNGGPCPPAECMTSFDCSGATKECMYRRCDGDECTSVSVTVAASDPCPLDECTGDNMCSVGGAGGGIFEDLGM